MKISKTLILMAVGVLLLNGCDKIPSLISSKASKENTSSAMAAPKKEQGFWSWVFGSSTPKNDKANTPESTPAPDAKKTA